MLDLDEKVYEVREYSKFPEKRYFSDKLVRTFSKQEDALYESIFYNKKYPDRRFYATDNPHEFVELKKKDLELLTKYGIL